MRRDLVWACVAILALICGYLFGRSETGDGPVRQDRSVHVPDAPIESRAPDQDALQVGDAVEVGPPEYPLTPARLSEVVGLYWEKETGRKPTEEERRRIRQAADSAREDIRVQYERAEFMQAMLLGKQFHKELRLLEDAKRGGTMAFLRKLGASKARMPRLVADPRAFGAHFERRVSGPRLDGTNLDWREPIADGATLEYPAGVHSIDTDRLFRGQKRFPKDLLIVGLGMNETLLRIDEISTNEEIANLTFRNLTIDCDSDYMTDLRDDSPATIRLENCRVVGFDMAAGGSVMFAARTGAFYATDCRFEAGYCRAAATGSGNLFRVGRGLLVRMENCLFVGPFRSVYDSNSAATYQFENCEIRDRARALSRCKTDANKGVTFESCTLVAMTESSDPIFRTFSAINPDWPDRNR